MQNIKAIVKEIVDNFKSLHPIPTDIKAQGQIPSGIKAVLFDVYGTLLVSGVGEIGISFMDSGSANVDSLLENCGFPCRKKVSKNFTKIFKIVIAQHHRILQKKGIDYPEVDIREVWSDILNLLWKDAYLVNLPKYNEAVLEELALRYEAAINPLWPMPGFPHIVRTLVNAGILVGIVSNAQFYTPLFLEAFAGCPLTDLGVKEKFCAWSWKERYAKPSPHIFTGLLDALQAKGIGPDSILYVGNDMLNDVGAAAANGCRTCLFVGDKRSLRLRKRDVRVRANPNVIISDLRMLEDIGNV